ncbi:MAG: two-component regulator propeller domain-containing protein [Flavobacterium sp.]
MKKCLQFYTLLLILFLYTSCRQSQTEGKKIIINSEIKDVITSHGPEWISRNIIQDRKNNIWIAAFSGIFRYDGKSFANITSKVIKARFFSLLEDRNGNLWFGSIGSGVFYYDGKSFQNFSTTNGLLNNEVTSIYEDKKGNMWFGVSGGVSCYDGNSFRNYIIDGDVMNEDRTGKTFPNRRPYEINSIICI